MDTLADAADILLILAGLLLLVFLFMRLYPAFGGKAPKEDLRQSPHYRDGTFSNLIPTSMNMDLKTNLAVLREFVKGNPKGRPGRPLGVEPLPLPLNGAQGRVTWFGHSALLLELDGKTMLLDPMFGKTPSPFPLFGGKRYSGPLPELEKLPAIDVVFLSHDHYDHLDYGSIRRIKNKVKRFCVPLGVGSHLERWGVERARIEEHDWWEEFECDGLRLACTPARHFSGRRLTDRNSTLWCSWVIAGRHASVYFSGDSGYGPHFAEIGEKYGPFDLTLMECGQYDERWAAIHMMPEQTVQAHLDVKGRVMLPIHWSAFTLALHEWTDPIERVTKAARERGAHVSTPRIGEPVLIGAAEYPDSAWWRTY
ncbi:MBL fold metallo-hydrolase [Paenibacillus sp. MBLB4367]|uniref:MBL fold metallo-hydrolase n=1 Tax=Paenibacillus sp. MBLB4367 TaxID=3384767 RepID=UPI003908322C